MREEMPAKHATEKLQETIQDVINDNAVITHAILSLLESIDCIVGASENDYDVMEKGMNKEDCAMPNMGASLVDNRMTLQRAEDLAQCIRRHLR